MTLSAFVPKDTLVYVGLRLPENIFAVDALDIERLLDGYEWEIKQVPRTSHAENPGRDFIEIDQPWGKSRAFAGDYILKGSLGVSVVSGHAFRGMRFTEIVA